MNGFSFWVGTFHLNGTPTHRDGVAMNGAQFLNRDGFRAQGVACGLELFAGAWVCC
jgi:hypothetical protein